MSKLEVVRECKERMTKIRLLEPGDLFRDPKEPGIVFMVIKPPSHPNLQHAVRLNGPHAGSNCMFTSHDFPVMEIRGTLTTQDA